MCGKASRRISVNYGCHNAECQETDHIIQSYNLQQRIHKFTLCLILIDGHHGTGRGCGRGDSSKYQGEFPVQIKNKFQTEGHQNPGGQCLADGDDNNSPPRPHKHFFFEEFTHAEGDKRQRQITDKAHPVNHRRRNKIKTAGTNEYTRQNVTAHLWHVQSISHPCQNKSRKQNNRERQQYFCLSIQLR